MVSVSDDDPCASWDGANAVMLPTSTTGKIPTCIAPPPGPTPAAHTRYRPTGSASVSTVHTDVRGRALALALNNTEASDLAEYPCLVHSSVVLRRKIASAAVSPDPVTVISVVASKISSAGVNDPTLAPTPSRTEPTWLL